MLKKSFISGGTNHRSKPPGITDTPMFAGSSEQQKASMMQRFPLGRFAEPSEIAEGAIFLISEKASLMTGENMHTNGGSNFGG